MGNIKLSNKHWFFMLSLMASPSAFSQDSHSDEAAMGEQPISAMDDFVNRYFMEDSYERRAEERSPTMAESDLVVHFFQQGPDNKGFFPQLQTLSGDSCEDSSDMEFATRWERDLDNNLKLKDATIMVGPSYSFKSRTSKGKHLRHNIPQPLIGEFSAFGIEAGKFSRSFAGKEFQEQLDSGQMRVTTLLDESNDKELSFEVEEPGRTPKRQTIDLTESAYLRTSAGYASLMPYSVFFTPKHTPFEKNDNPLITDKRWLRRNDFGTAIHGADKKHLLCRPNDVTAGSAGCGRVNSSFARRTFDSFRLYLESQGGVVTGEGNLYIHETPVRDENGRHIADKFVDTPDNLKNIKAILALRRNSSIKGFVPTSANEMVKHYESLRLPTWREVESAHRQGELSADLTQIMDERNQIIRKLSASRRRKGNENKTAELQSKLNELSAKYVEHVKHVAQAPDTRFEDLHPSVQKMYLVEKQANLYREIAKNDPAKADIPMNAPNSEELSMYRSNEKQLYSVIADALEEYYAMHYGENVPRKCQEQIRAYRNHVPQETPARRAIPVNPQRNSEVRVLRAIPVEQDN